MSALHHLGSRERKTFQPRGWPIFESAPRTSNADCIASAHDSGNTAPGDSNLAEESNAFHSLLEHAATYSFLILFATVLYNLLTHLAQQQRLWLIMPAIPLGLLAGDFVSGLVHWLADTYGSERTPLVGRNFIKWFRRHHLFSQDICAHGFIATNGNTCILAAPLTALCLLLIQQEDVSALRAFTVLVVVLMTVTTVATNQFHKWSHDDAPARLVRWLQRSRIILHPRHHSLHHREPFAANYCIANGWLNPLLERVKFFPMLERAMRRLGIKSNRQS